MSTPSTSEALGPVEVHAAYEVVADRLRRAIHLGVLSPGELLPPERDLAALLGVSRVTVREALRTLQGAGYVTRRRGAAHGTQVASPSADPAVLRADLLARMDEVDALCELRAIVEAGAARLAAARPAAAGLAALDAAVSELDAVADVGAFRGADNRFHLAVARMAANVPLERAVADAREQLFAVVDLQPYTLLVQRTRGDHAALRDAIAAGDGEAAAARMAAHVRDGHAELREALGL